MQDVLELVNGYRKSHNPELLEAALKAITVDITLYVTGRVPESDIFDVRQEIFIEIVKGLKSFKGATRESFFSWCYVISRAAIAKYYRKRERQPQTHPDYEEFVKLIDRNAERRHLSEQAKRDAFEALDRIRQADPECAELLYRRHILDFPYEELGEHYGISANAARMRVNRCEESSLKG